MPAQKRDNDYYLRRLRSGWPQLARDVDAGVISVAQARKLAGLGGNRTRLHELKNAWDKASKAERTSFLLWVKTATTGIPSRPLPAPTHTAWDKDERLLPWAKSRIEDVMSRRGMSPGQVADELGIRRSDTSISMALARGSKVKVLTTRQAIDTWLAANSAI